MRRRILTLSAALVFAAGIASAQTTMERTAARSAASSGIAAYNAGNYDKAIELLLRAESAVHAPPHLLYLARAYEKEDRLIEAQELYIRMVNEQLAADAPKAFARAQQDARTELAALEPRLPHATLTLGGEGTDGAEITIDGVVFPRIALDVATPVNPGKHVVHVVAPQAEDLEVEFTVAEGASATVNLQLQPVQSTPAVSESSPSEASVQVAVPEDQESSLSNWQRPVGWGAIGVGGAGLVLGGVFGVLALNEQEKLDGQGCVDAACPVGTDIDKLNQLRTFSTIGFVAGGVLAAAGVTLLLTAPDSAESTTLSASFGPGHISVGGQF